LLAAVGCGTVHEAPVTGSTSEPNDAAWPMPTAPGLGLPNARHYDTAESETVVDLVTGLVWQAAVPEETFTWQEAADHCTELRLGGRDGYRLPTRIELVSLLDLERTEPAIDTTAFPETPGEWFWSSSSSAEEPTRAWYAYFYFGYPDVGEQESTFRVRCVASPAEKPRTGARYELAGSSVRDRRTGLTFQQSVAPEALTQEDATRYCDDLELDEHGDWRLPSMPELQTLVDERVRAPAIDATAFPDTASGAFWTGSVWAGSAELAWYVSFDYGAALYDLRTTKNAVRCVH